METYRQLCLQRQTELRQILTRPGQHEQAMQLLLSQHAMLHAAKMAQTEPWSFDDEVFSDTSEAQIRRIPHNGEHSIAWLIWHIARCEDITMNLLVAGSPQVLHDQGWLEGMKVSVRDTGNAMDRNAVAAFSEAVDIAALRAYRLAVGRRTRQIAQGLTAQQLKHKVEPPRLQRIWDEGAVVEAARDIVEYWGRRDTAGLLLMPATRHNLIHLNEALQLKRLGKQ